MIEIRLHGRGGQGGVTAAELIAQAAISEGNYAQGFPSFGPERRGAPITAYIRMSEDPIYLREPIEHPDVVVVMDESLVDMVDVFEGMKKGGTIIINTSTHNSDRLLTMAEGYNLAIVDASKIALEVLGVPITNTAIIGAIVNATKICDLKSLKQPLANRFGRLADKNWIAMETAFKLTQVFGKQISQPDDGTEIYEIDALYAVDDLEIGAEIIQPGNSKEFLTGNWRTAGKPVIDKKKCIKCGFCWMLCPDMAFSKNEEGFYDWDGKFCKGCAICVEECPKNAIEMEGEKV